MSGNFAYLIEVWPEIAADCGSAESYMTSDPTAACIYARRAIEKLVRRIYDVDRIAAPYRDDLAAHLRNPPFTRRVDERILLKLTVIKDKGNQAAHDNARTDPQTGERVVRELYDAVIWAAQRYTGRQNQVPAGAVFDKSLALRSAVVSRTQVEGLIAKFRAQDADRAAALAASETAAAEAEAEITRLREQLAAEQATEPLVDPHDYSEAQTRTDIIDELLAEAGWHLTDARDREYPVTGMPNESGEGFVDYVLWGADGLPLAVIEAKRASVDATRGQQQAKLYADCLQAQFGRRPVIFYTNGFVTTLWDDAADYPPRQVAGFLTRDELELTISRRSGRLPLAKAVINPAVVDRHYQQRAIRAVDDTFEARGRSALLVMATGTGKTRVAIALAQQLIDAGWVKRVLFLADRTALVKQAVKRFKEYLPSAPAVNLVTERATDGRVYASTYPTMMNLIDTFEADGTRRFGTGHFDLIIIDEAHRSVYQKYGAIFDYFDALLVGLTATPKDEIDRNTYRLFALEDGVPTDAYSLAEAVDEGYLVPPRAVSVPTKFLREGIRYADLSDADREQWDELDWNEDGDIPDEVTASEINTFLFNADTVDKVLATLMTEGHRVAGGDQLGKTIIFAKNQRHADFIAARFDANYPEYGGTFARVITHSVSYAQSLIDDFEVPGKAPHIAISVDMLDTGIDVPDVVNLVLFKPVHSKTKFWQMIGRGTRLRPDLYGPGEDKSNFYVFDVCGNLEYFSADMPEGAGSAGTSLAERLFAARLELVAAIDQRIADADREVGADGGSDAGERSEPGLRADIAWMLREHVLGMNVANFLVRPHRETVERWTSLEPWSARLGADDVINLATELGGLPSAHTVAGDGEEAKRFDVTLLSLQLAALKSDIGTFDKLRRTVQQVAESLLTMLAIPAVAAQRELLDRVAGDDWWIDVTLPMLEVARRRIRGLVRFVDRSQRAIMYTDFADTAGQAIAVELPIVVPGTNWQRFREKARAYLRNNEDNLALQRLKRNEQLTAQDLDELGRMLVAAGVGSESDVQRAADEADGLGIFIRSLVGLDHGAAALAFDRFLTDKTLGRAQLHFISLIVDHLTAGGVMDPARLYESPFTDSAPTGPDGLFDQGQLADIVSILRTVRAHADPTAITA